MVRGTKTNIKKAKDTFLGKLAAELVRRGKAHVEDFCFMDNVKSNMIYMSVTGDKQNLLEWYVAYEDSKNVYISHLLPGPDKTFESISGRFEKSGDDMKDICFLCIHLESVAK